MQKTAVKLSEKLSRALRQIKQKTQGFTLIELLVVIAIIGILATIVVAQLNRARIGSRDAKRLGDIGQIRNGLELYFDDNAGYPDNTSSLKGTYLANVPTDPLSSGALCRPSYCYATLQSAPKTHYHTGALLENKNHKALSEDQDCNSAATPPSGCPTTSPFGTGKFDGTDTSNPVYDIAQ